MFAFALALILATPAAAQDWRHRPSGISLPSLPDGFRVGRETDNRRDGSDVFVQLGSDDEPATLYVYRSAYPGAAIWFERTRLAMRANVGAPTGNVAPRSFTLGAATAPNGLREEIDIPAGGRWRATAVAIVQYGDWIVKARLTSARLDAAGLGRRLDALLGALRFPAGAPAARPLIVPSPCGEANAMRGRARDRSSEDNVRAGIVLVGINAEARGREGLVANPEAWCRASSRHPAAIVSLYRRRDGRAWVALVSDSGVAAGAEQVDDLGMAFAATPAATIFVQMYDGMPDPDPAIEAAIPYLVGRAQGPASVDAATGTQISVSMPER
ncbi:MAG TPA: hypothetical protein VMG08_16995 [Allosphingosinicella sp.]|nr:hypothetical protein [Allosphingosinicella sp.]